MRCGRVSRTPGSYCIDTDAPPKDPVLELGDGREGSWASTGDWRSNQEGDIINTTMPPGGDRESAIVRTLGAGGYTAVVRGAGNSTGIVLVEVCVLD